MLLVRSAFPPNVHPKFRKLGTKLASGCREMRGDVKNPLLAFSTAKTLSRAQVPLPRPVGWPSAFRAEGAEGAERASVTAPELYCGAPGESILNASR